MLQVFCRTRRCHWTGNRVSTKASRKSWPYVSFWRSNGFSARGWNSRVRGFIWSLQIELGNAGLNGFIIPFPVRALRWKRTSPWSCLVAMGSIGRLFVCVEVDHIAPLTHISQISFSWTSVQHDGFEGVYNTAPEENPPTSQGKNSQSPSMADRDPLSIQSKAGHPRTESDLAC